MNAERWVWLEVAVSPVTKRSKANPSINRHYIPEKILDYTPSYKAQLKEKLASIEGDDEPVIRDDDPRDPQVVTKAIRFLVSGYLTPLDASSDDCEKTLDSLMELWYYGWRSSNMHLYLAAVSHIEESKAITPKAFLAFARRFYDKYAEDYGDRIHTTSMGRMIRRKLAFFLPRLQESMTIDEISSEGGVLGKQLMVALLEDRNKKDSTSGFKTKTEVKEDGASGSKTKTEVEGE
jgi:hypothetical protein